MGATWFEINRRGKSLSNAYDTARDMAEEEYGHQDGYNGTISTTIGVRDETELYSKSKFNSTDTYINSRSSNMNKRDCSAICIEKPILNNNKTKTQVEHIVTPGTKRWILKYEVISEQTGHFITSCITKTEAVTKARAYTEKHLETTRITMTKVLDKGSAIVATIKYKKSTTEKDGRWIFFGYAAE